MVKVTNRAKKLLTTEQASIKAGRTCADSCSDGCVGHCDDSGVNDFETALQWAGYGIANPDTSFPTP